MNLMPATLLRLQAHLLTVLGVIRVRSNCCAVAGNGLRVAQLG